MIKTLMMIISLFQLVQADWVTEMEEQLVKLEETLDGELGVYIKDLSGNRVLCYNCDENWYFASTVKIPLAIAVLQ